MQKSDQLPEEFARLLLSDTIQRVLNGEKSGNDTADASLKAVAARVRCAVAHPEAVPDALNPLVNDAPGSVLPVKNVSGHYLVRGEKHSYIIDARRMRCPCSQGMRGLPPCEHIRSLRLKLKGERPETCPTCHGCGDRFLTRVELEEVMAGAPLSPTPCADCCGDGVVTPALARQIAYRKKGASRAAP